MLLIFNADLCQIIFMRLLTSYAERYGEPVAETITRIDGTVILGLYRLNRKLRICRYLGNRVFVEY